VNFKNQRKFRFFYEDGFNGFTANDAWQYMEIRGSRGMLYPYSEKEIGIQIKRKHFSRVRLAEQIPGSVKIQDADDLIVFRVPDSAFEAAGRIVGAYKKRTLTPERRDAAMATLARFHSAPRPRPTDRA